MQRATVIVLTAGLGIAAGAGCRTAAPAVAPGNPVGAGQSPPPKTAPSASPAPAARPQAAKPQEGERRARSAPEETAPPDETVEPPEEGGASGDESGADPQSLQKDALEMCQSASEHLERGEIDDAVVALDRAYALMLELPGNGDDSFLQAKEDIRLLVADLITRVYHHGRTAPAAPMTSWDLALPIVSNDQVQREIQSFVTVERDQFLEGFRRSGRYHSMIVAKLQAAGLPSQLAWLPLVESWFKVRALSRASALGLWQFISSTGVRYGLSRDAWIDERLDPEKSTDAAIAYLVELHGLFGDWPKALAAYNCGEAQVQRLQRRSADQYQDFWDLYALLPGETRRYVPRLFAALQIIENPARYGLALPEPDPPLGEVTTVKVERSVKLEQLDHVLGLEPGTLAALNPELRYAATPKRSYALRAPGGRQEALRAQIDSLPEWKPPTPQFVTHRVRRGETLSVIARSYHTTVPAVMRVNGLRSANRIWPGQRLRIPVRGAVPVLPASQIASGKGGRRYHVSRGDTLAGIAEALGVPLGELLRVNGLRPNSTIHPGQSLAVPD